MGIVFTKHFPTFPLPRKSFAFHGNLLFIPIPVGISWDSIPSGIPFPCTIAHL